MQSGRILKGRVKITSDVSLDDINGGDIEKIVSVVNHAMTHHNVNQSDIEYLFNYKLGKQTILQKEKSVREEINNKLVINHASMITRNIVGYLFGNPIQYIQNGSSTKKEQLDLLNRYVQYEDKASVDSEIAEIQSVCGTAYRVIYTDGAYGDEVPFEDKALDPRNTFVVYENSVAERQLMGVTYFNKLDEHGNNDGMRWHVYTENGMYLFENKGSSSLQASDFISKVPYNVGGVPIIEYPNNRWRLGDWELCIGLMDAINSLHSGRLDDIDQTVQSLLIFINAEIDEEKYTEMRECGIVQLTNNSTNQSDIKSINNTLDQNGMNSFAKELSDMLYAIIGIPTRDGTSGGGDTGQAVELRDGWADLEIVARNKEVEFKRSEKRALKIFINIMNNKVKTNLSLIDIDIKFSRNKNNNLLVKTQGYANLLSTRTLDPADCLTIVDLVSDVNEFIERGKAFWGDQFAGQQPEVQAETQITGEGDEVKVDESNPKTKTNKNTEEKPKTTRSRTKSVNKDTK